jgi:biotin carboxyl carrier protein
MVRYSVTVGGEKRTVQVEQQADKGDGVLTVTVEGLDRKLEVRPLGGGRYAWLDGSRVVNADVDRLGEKLAVTVRGHTFPVEVADARLEELPQVAPVATRTRGPSVLRAPMAGRVVKLLARVGDAIKAGQGVLVIEAMKMENEVRATREGQLRELRVAEGAAVDGGQELAVLE